MSSDLIQFTTELVSAWNDHDLARILQYYKEDYYGEDVSQANPILGHHGIEKTFIAVLRAFPDLTITDRDWVAQENRLAVAWRMQGTQQGVIMSIPPTGRTVSVRGSSFFSLIEGKIARGIHIWDVAGLIRCLGLLPEL